MCVLRERPLGNDHSEKLVAFAVLALACLEKPRIERGLIWIHVLGEFAFDRGRRPRFAHQISRPPVLFQFFDGGRQVLINISFGALAFVLDAKLNVPDDLIDSRLPICLLFVAR